MSAGSPTPKPRVFVEKWLYVSHFFSAWGWRKYEYGIGLLLASLWPDSVLLPSIFGLVESTVAAFGGGPVGQLQDSTRDNRLAFVRGSLLTQNACIAASVAAMLPVLLLSHRDATGAVQVSWWFALAAGATMLLGSLARLGSIGSNVAVERDWVTVVAGGDAARLADMNATMRRLDLVCKILAPIVAGLLLSGTSPAVVVIFIGAWNVLSMAPELLFLQWAFAAEPRLALSPPPPKQPQRPAQLASYGTLPVDAPEVDAPPARPSCWAVATSSCRTLGSGWRVWAMQRIFPAALALSLLYVSTIAFGAIMTVFLNWAGIPVFALAAARGVGAAFGVLATLTFKPLRKRFGVHKVGLLSIWLQVACVSLALAIVPYTLSTAVADRTQPREGERQQLSSWTVPPDLPVPLWASCLMISGVVLSRFGLWSFDLTVTTLLQVGVPDHVRGTVNGVQNSVNMLMGFLEFLMGIAFSNAASFAYPTAISVAFVLGAAVLYTWYVSTAPFDAQFDLPGHVVDGAGGGALQGQGRADSGGHSTDEEVAPIDCPQPTAGVQAGE